MPPRLRLTGSQLPVVATKPKSNATLQCRYASVAAATTTATTPAPSTHERIEVVSAIHRYPPTQPPSYKLPQLRKSQLHRQYQSLLKSTPLILLFQHNNLTANELNGIRRELSSALRKVDATEQTHLADFIKLQVIQTGIFLSALRAVEFFDPSNPPKPKPGLDIQDPKFDPTLTHGLSFTAHRASRIARKYHNKRSDLEPLLSGPLLVLTTPTISTAHLKAAISILAPSEGFPAPKRKANPSYHEPAVQSGIQKLLLVGARAEGRTFDLEGAKWIGSIEGGLVGLQAQLVALLQQFGVGVASTLETASKSLYFTLEGRKGMLEEESRPREEEQATSLPESEK